MPESTVERLLISSSVRHGCVYWLILYADQTLNRNPQLVLHSCCSYRYAPLANFPQAFCLMHCGAPLYRCIISRPY